jgi:hypothetical protein
MNVLPKAPQPEQGQSACLNIHCKPKKRCPRCKLNAVLVKREMRDDDGNKLK